MMQVGNAEDCIGQFWCLASRARAAMRFGIAYDHLPGLIEDLTDISRDSQIAGVRQGARYVLLDFVNQQAAIEQFVHIGDRA